MNRTELITKMFHSLRDFSKSSRLHEGEHQCLISFALDHALAIIGQDESINIKLLAQALKITSGAATQQVIALEESGYVTRHHNPTDRRETHVSLTNKGKEARAEVLRVQTKAAEAIFAPLSDQEMLQLSQIIEKITATDKERA